MSPFFSLSLSLSMPPNLFVSSVSSFWWLCFVLWCNGLDWCWRIWRIYRCPKKLVAQLWTWATPTWSPSHIPRGAAAHHRSPLTTWPTADAPALRPCAGPCVPTTAAASGRALEGVEMVMEHPKKVGSMGGFPLMEYPPFMDVRWIYPVIDGVPVSQWWFNSPLPSSIAGGQRLSEKMEKWNTIERSGFVWKLVLSIKGIRWLWLSFQPPIRFNIEHKTLLVIDYYWNRASRLKTVAPPV